MIYLYGYISLMLSVFYIVVNTDIIIFIIVCDIFTISLIVLILASSLQIIRIVINKLVFLKL